MLNSTNSEDGLSPAESEAPLTSDASCDASPATQRDRAPALLSDVGIERPPGPGLFESIAWVVLVLVIHGLGGLVAFLVILMTYANGPLPAQPEQLMRFLQQALQDMPPQATFVLIAVEMGVFLAAVVPLCLLRIGRQPLRKLNLSALSATQFGLLLAGTLPLAVLSGALHQQCVAAWEVITQQLGADMFAGMDINQKLGGMTEGVPLLLLVLVIAVIPAIGEELVFRGVIARGLTANYGIVLSVIVTSVLFGMVHLHPAHAVAVIPLGMFLHVAYVSTRSLLAPILVHFLNNGFAAVVMTLSQKAAQPGGVGLPEAAAGKPQSTPVVLVVLAFASVVMTLLALRRNRTRYVTETGEAWSPGFDSLEHPSASVGVVRTVDPYSPTDLVTIVLSGLLSGAIFAGMLVTTFQPHE